DRRILDRLWQILDESAVDLERGNREALQIDQRRIAGAEIVDRDAHAAGRNFSQNLFGMLGVGHQDAFGDFQHQLVAVEPGQLERIVHHLDELVAAELARTDVDRYIQLAPGGFLETLQLEAGDLERPRAEQVDQAVVLGHRNELVRLYQA